MSDSCHLAQNAQNTTVSDDLGFTESVGERGGVCGGSRSGLSDGDAKRFSFM